MVVNYNVRRQEPGLTIMDFTGQLTLGNALKGVEYAIKDLIKRGQQKVGVGFYSKYVEPAIYKLSCGVILREADQTPTGLPSVTSRPALTEKSAIAVLASRRKTRQPFTLTYNGQGCVRPPTPS